MWVGGWVGGGVVCWCVGPRATGGGGAHYSWPLFHHQTAMKQSIIRSSTGDPASAQHTVLTSPSQSFDQWSNIRPLPNQPHGRSRDTPVTDRKARVALVGGSDELLFEIYHQKWGWSDELLFEIYHQKWRFSSCAANKNLLGSINLCIMQ